MATKNSLGFDPRDRQLALFDVEPSERGAAVEEMSFARARRTVLDDSSWVEHVPGWLKGGQQLFDRLLSAANWEQRDRWMFERYVQEPRLTAQYPALREVPVALLEDCGAALSRHYDVPYDGLWLNLYRDHRDSTSWHADKVACQQDVCIVPVLSLGATRQFLIRPRAGGRALAFSPENGDLIVMGGRCQRDWLHSVPKQTRSAGARISVNFQSSRQAVI